ncbi:MAG: hypothetical protein AAGG51_20950 [Cyanobacteria bacterium P01_G01_bin.54]
MQDLLEQLESYSGLGLPMGRSMIGDTQLTQAEDAVSLVALANRYNCLPDEPDYRFSKDKPVGRYRFASALAVCAEHLYKIAIQTGSIEFINAEDRATFQRHVQAFEPELTFFDIAQENFAFLGGVVAARQDNISFAVTVSIVPMAGLEFVDVNGGYSLPSTIYSENAGDQLLETLPLDDEDDRLITRLSTGCLPPLSLSSPTAEVDNGAPLSQFIVADDFVIANQSNFVFTSMMNYASNYTIQEMLQP